MIQSESQNVQNLAEREYSQSPFYLHPLNTDTSLLSTVCFAPEQRKPLDFLSF